MSGAYLSHAPRFQRKSLEVIVHFIDSADLQTKGRKTGLNRKLVYLEKYKTKKHLMESNRIDPTEMFKKHQK